MALIDDIEHYGRLVDSGAMTRAAAAQALAKASDGGLTEVGAGRLITEWKTARTTYAGAFKDAGEGWARAHGFDL